jgi:arylsulfatase A-like enzyme
LNARLRTIALERVPVRAFAPRRIAVGLALASALACGAGPERGGVLGAPPAEAPIHLASHSGTIAPDPSSPGESAPALGAPLATFDAEALLGWTAVPSEDGVSFGSPPLAPRGLAGVGTLQLRVRPGGATQVAVVPWAQGEQLAREHRALRRLELALERDADPDAPVELALDLQEALHGNFGDAGRGGRLARLEVILPGAEPGRAALLALTIEPKRILPPEAVAASLVVDHGDVLRPSWAVRARARVELEVRVPGGSPELRWYAGALPGTGEQRIEVVTDEGSELLAREAPVLGRGGLPWSPRAHSLARFAGRTIRLRLSVAPVAREDGTLVDGGVGLFGDPTLVPAAVRAADSGATPDVLLYLIDTLRADHVGAYGSRVPGVSPTLDRLIREGVAFRRAQSSSPWTKPAIATLMSGILPTTHGVGATRYTDRMPESVPLVQGRFRDAGWRTGSFSASPLGSTLSALERGFDVALPPRHWRAHARLDLNPAADQLHERMLAWVDEQPDRPFFAYVHTLEVHEWKLARYRSGLPGGGTAYDAAIFDADRQLGALVGELERRGRDVMIVVVSDHGESWGDHGMPSHGFGLYQSQIHVPLVFWRGGALTRRLVTEPVSLSDIAPTLLDGFGLPPLDESDGVPLTPAFAGRTLERGPVLSALLRFVWAPRAPRQYAVTLPGEVVSIRSEAGTEHSFDLVIDPQELRPLASPDAAASQALDALLAGQAERARAFRARHGEVVPGPVNPEDSERLRALGYLEEVELEEVELEKVELEAGDAPGAPDAQPPPHPGAP